jgi:hypothetical protein
MDASDLKESYGHWNSHPVYRVSDWMEIVSYGDTRLGYWEWVADQIELEEE